MFFSGMDDPMDMMNMLHTMGMGGHMGGGRQRGGPEQKQIPLEVTLEDLYNGKEVGIENPREILCRTCRGSGASQKSGKKTVTCQKCSGSGQQVSLRQMGPMVMQTQSTCTQCNGSGRSIRPEDMCKKCNGQCVERVVEELNVVIPPGSAHKEGFLFKGHGNQSPGDRVPGDVSVLLHQRDHEIFTRENESNLRMTHKLTVGEALCGFQFTITHLDGRVLIVRNEPGSIIRPGDMKCITGEGMPVKSDPNIIGDLIIQFEVVYPTMLNEYQLEILRTALPGPKDGPIPYDEENAEIAYMQPEDLDVVRAKLAREQEADDEDEDEGPQQMQCAHQ